MLYKNIQKSCNIEKSAKNPVYLQILYKLTNFYFASSQKSYQIKKNKDLENLKIYQKFQKAPYKGPFLTILTSLLMWVTHHVPYHLGNVGKKVRTKVSSRQPPPISVYVIFQKPIITKTKTKSLSHKNFNCVAKHSF